MKCLSLRQPFASLLASGKKSIELRKWNTKFRGKFLVHAAKKIDIDNCNRLGIDFDNLITGSIIGCAILYDVKVYQDKNEFTRDYDKHFALEQRYTKDNYRYGFVVGNAKVLKKTIPYSGMLGFFNVDPVILNINNENK